MAVSSEASCALKRHAGAGSSRRTRSSWTTEENTLAQTENRVAIVTGASGMRGIGRAIALRFARQGLAIALVDIHRDPAQIPPAELGAGWRGIESVREEIAAAGGRAICLHADISDAAQV